MRKARAGVAMPNLDLFGQAPVVIARKSNSGRPRVALRIMIALLYLKHAVQDGRRRRGGEFLIVSERFQFVEVGPSGDFKDAGAAPYLDYSAATESELVVLDKVPDADWLKQDWEHRALGFSLREIVPGHGSIS